MHLTPSRGRRQARVSMPAPSSTTCLTGSPDEAAAPSPSRLSSGTGSPRVALRMASSKYFTCATPHDGSWSVVQPTTATWDYGSVLSAYGTTSIGLLMLKCCEIVASLRLNGFQDTQSSCPATRQTDVVIVWTIYCGAASQTSVVPKLGSAESESVASFMILTRMPKRPTVWPASVPLGTPPRVPNQPLPVLPFVACTASSAIRCFANSMASDPARSSARGS